MCIKGEGGGVVSYAVFFLVASLGDYENGWRMPGLGKSGYEALVAAQKILSRAVVGDFFFIFLFPMSWFFLDPFHGVPGI